MNRFCLVWNQRAIAGFLLFLLFLLLLLLFVVTLMHQPRICCTRCAVTSTPKWRKAPDTRVILCNRCGLRASKWRKRVIREFKRLHILVEIACEEHKRLTRTTTATHTEALKYVS